MPYTSHDAFVAAYRLDILGHGSPVTKDELFQAWRQSNEPLWLHLDLTAPSNIDHYLHDIAQLDHSQCTAMCEEVTRPRVAHFGNGLLTTLRGINTSPEAEYDDLVTLRIFMSSNRLITVRRRPLKPIEDIMGLLAEGAGPRSATELLGMLADRIIDQFGDRMTALDETLSQLEKQQLDEDDIDMAQLSMLRRPMITLRQFMEPQYACLSRLAEATDGLEPMTRLIMRESANQQYRYIEDVRAMQERALILQEQMWNTHNEQLNNRLYQLSFISVLFLPLTFLTGLLGINVGGIPGNENPHAFWIVVGICALLTIVLILMMKRWNR
ncbi:CorA family divalent cation transporter [Zymobacter sp. IVIA_12111.31 C1]|uniref:CorA family divalent cation transporter n=1 Tax=Zymobacter sp. IVIA_12111.31 C1 TaxID=3394854 RepID=UPI0039C25C86